MRIISGSAKGHRISAPRGRTTRPTPDRVREALFSLIDARVTLEGTHFLDLFAGSGAIGLEAISRGASSATFVENQVAALKTLSKNIDALGFGDRCRVIVADVHRALHRIAETGQTYSIIFADPPYRLDATELLATFAEVLPSLYPDLVIFEHARKTDAPAECGTLKQLALKTYGDTALSVYGVL